MQLDVTIDNKIPATFYPLLRIIGLPGSGFLAFGSNCFGALVTLGMGLDFLKIL